MDLSEARSLRAPASEAEVEAIDEIEGARVWDPLPSLCSADSCFVELDNDILYIDTHHLSEIGALYLARDLVPAMDDAFGLE